MPTPPRRTIRAETPDVKNAQERTAMIDAAERCFARLGIDVATMDDIAAEAGVSRRTLYRYLGGQRQVLDAVTRRAVDRFWDDFHKEYGEAEDFCDYLIDKLIYTLKRAAKTKTHRFLFDRSMLPLVNKLYIDSPDFVRHQARALDAAYQRLRQRPGIRQNLDMLMLCEWQNRIIVSFLATPSAFFRSEQELRALFSAMLEPVIRVDKTPDTQSSSGLPRGDVSRRKG